MTTFNLSCTVNQLQQLRQFIYTHNLCPGDAIIVKEHGQGLFRDLLDHYVIYLGDTHFMANYRDGAKILTCPVIYRFLPSMRVDRIRRFKGNDFERRTAVRRALAHRDKESYHLIVNNCEHFANEVQYGMGYSDQVLMGGTVATLAGLGLLSAQDEMLRFLGGLLSVTGSIVAAGELARRKG